jgi:hypothetical protein
MQPLARGYRITMKTDASFVKPNDRLSSVERLEIYSRSYWFRVSDALYDDFPGLRAVIGQRAFHRLSRAYLADCPSQFAGSRHALALDMVRLEWAHIEAFDNAAEKVLGPEDLLELGPGLRVTLQPYIRLLALQYPVDDLRIRGTAGASRLKPELIFLAVHRMNFTVYYRRIAPEEYRLLTGLHDGQTVGRAIREAFRNSSASAEEQQSMLEKWFAVWAQLGWLCPPTRSKRKRLTQ